MPRFRPIVALDWLALAAFLLMVLTELTGGFYALVAGVRLSSRGMERPALALAIVFLIRVALDRQTLPFNLSRDRFNRLLAGVVQRSTDPETSTPVGRSWRSTALALVGLCAVVGLVLHAQLGRMHAVPDLGDPLLSMWRMGWVYQQLTGDPRALFDANIFHPEPLTFTYSDSMLLPALTAAPLLALGIHPVHAYNVLFLSGFFVSGIAVYLLVERVTGSARAAFIGGLVYALYPYRFEHYSHLELQITYWMPPALLALHRFADTGRFRYAAVAALCLAAQFYSSMYYGVFFLLYGAAVLLVLLFPLRTRRRWLVPGGAAFLLAIALLVPLARPYLSAHAVKGDRDRGAVEAFSARRSDYLVAHHRSALYGERLQEGRQTERALFPGVLPLVLSGASLVPPLGMTRLAYAAGLLVAFDGSLGFHGTSYPYLHDWFRPIRSLRVPARFSVLVGLSLAVLAGFGVRRILSRLSGIVGSVAWVGLIAAVAFEATPALELHDAWQEPPPIYAELAGVRGVVLAEFPMSPEPAAFAENTPYMYFSLWHWSQMVNGYSGFAPPSYLNLARDLRAFPDGFSIDRLRHRGVTHVTINCALYRDGCDDILEAVDRMPGVFRLAADGQWQGSRVRLYELLR